MNHKQKLFVSEYLKDLNASAAAERAGYKQPYSQGPRLLENVEIAAELDKIRNRTTDRAIMEFDEACEILSDIARANISDYLDEAGHLDIKRGNPRAVQEVKVLATTKEGDTILSFKLHSKIQSVERLAKMLAWDKPVKVAPTTPDGTGQYEPKQYVDSDIIAAAIAKYADNAE